MNLQLKMIEKFSKEELVTEMKTNGVESTRVTRFGDKCNFYRNLNKKDMFSCRQRGGEFKNKVSGYANIFIVENPEFIISEASRQRVLKMKKRNVHSFIRASYVTALFDYDIKNEVLEMQCCSYNPYKEGYFYDVKTDEKILKTDCKYAILMGANVYLTNKLPQINC